jgi:hypothetical protein
MKKKNLLQTNLIEKVFYCSLNFFVVKIMNTVKNLHNIYIIMEYVKSDNV